MTVLPNQFSHPKYRPDIDGLRAVAVLSVVAFHAFPSLIKGGFIGVDIFFVISGFLISTIIFENLEKNTFSFSEFYSRRVKRIFPALIFVFIASYSFGWFALLADEYRQLGKHIAAGAGFVSNFVLWSESGYFDISTESKPLLHLWSLGIEEQFYIVWPFVLWFAWKRKFNLLTISVVAAILSFALNIKGIKHDPVATFYSPQTRFWELLSGSVLSWCVLYKREEFAGLKIKINNAISKILNNKNSIAVDNIIINCMALLGGFLLAYGFWRISKAVSFPGKWALIPVVAAVLIIAAGPNAWLNKKLLSNKFAVWIGLISFPLYLWHWPLLSFARIIEGGTPSVYIRVVAVALAVVFAWLSYRFIERPIRLGGRGQLKVGILLASMAILGFVGYKTYDMDGASFRRINQKYNSYNESIKTPGRLNECFEIAYAYKKDGDWFCRLGNNESPVMYFAYGDSHALSLLPAFERFAIDNNVRFNFTGTSGCPSLLGIQSLRGESGIEKYNCQKLNERVFNYVKESGIKSVILANRWTYYMKSFSRPIEVNLVSRDENISADSDSSQRDIFWAIDNTVSRYASIGVDVIFIEDTPQQIYNPKEILRKGGAIEFKYLEFSVSKDEHLRNQNKVNEALRGSGAKTINLDDVLCNSRICPLVANYKFLYSDDDHLSVEGAIFVSQHLSDRLRGKY